MRHILVSLAVAVMVTALFDRLAAGHGFELDLVNNTIQAHPEDQDNFSDHVFFAPMNQANAHNFFADHGGVEAESGINPSSDTLQITFLGPLWYSNGGAAQRASSDLTLEATSYDDSGNQLGNPVDITGTSNSPGTFPVAGDDAHSIDWELLNSSGSPAIAQGAYGFAYRVEGYKNGNLSMPFEASNPLVVVFNTTGFTVNPSLSNAQSAIFSSIMRGDFNLDGQRSTADISEMLSALTNLNAFQTSNGLQNADVSAIADVNQDGQITLADLQALLLLLKNGGQSTNAVPEPSGLMLMGSAVIVFAWRRWRK
jgi:hypothetical protein